MKAYRFCLPIALFGFALFSTSCQKEALEPETDSAFITKENRKILDAGILKLDEGNQAIDDASDIQTTNDPDGSGGTKLNSDDTIRDDYDTDKNAVDNSGGSKLNSDDTTRDDYNTNEKAVDSSGGTKLNSDDTGADAYKIPKRVDASGGTKQSQAGTTRDDYRAFAPPPSKN
jgi:hypothetical protein